MTERSDGCDRLFAVERIRKVEPQPARFQRPADFDLDKYLSGACGIIRGDIATLKVVVGSSPGG